MPPVDLIQALLAALSARGLGIEELSYDAPVSEPLSLWRRGDPADRLLLVLGDGGGGQVSFLHEAPQGEGRVYLDRRAAPTLIGETEFLLWRLQRGGGPVERRACAAEATGGGRLYVLKFELLAELLDQEAAEPEGGALERALLRLALTRAAAAQAAFSTAAPKLLHRVAERLSVFAEASAARRPAGSRLEAQSLREYLSVSLGAGAPEISRALSELTHSGVLASVKDASGREALQIRDLGRLNLLGDLALQRLGVDAARARAEVEALSHGGRLLEARNLALELLAAFPGDPFLIHRGALAMARMGATEEAARLLDELFTPRGEEDVPLLAPRPSAEGIERQALEAGRRLAGRRGEEGAPEASGAIAESDDVDLVRDLYALRARLLKDAWALERRRGLPGTDRLREAFRAYAELSDVVADDAYPACNAATLAALLGARSQAEAYARRVLEAPSGRDYWSLVSRLEGEIVAGGEEARILKLAAEAADRALEEGRVGDTASTRRQLLALSAVRPLAARVADLLPTQDVAAFIGHMIPEDTPLEAAQAHEAAAGAQLRERFRARRTQVLFTALARGGDLMAARAALEAQPALDLRVVLPIHEADFLKLSVGGPANASRRDWRKDFQELMGRSRAPLVVTPEKVLRRDMSAALVLGTQVMSGLALLESDRLVSRNRLFLALSAGGAATSAEGVVATAADWRARGLEPETIACPWRAPAPGDPEAAHPEPDVSAWRIAALALPDPGGAAALEAVFAAAGAERIPLARGVVAHGLPLSLEGVKALAAAAAAGCRVYADLAYQPDKHAQSFSARTPDAGSLAPGVAAISETLAGLIRYRFAEAVLLAPIGFLQRGRRRQAAGRDLAPSSMNYRLEVLGASSGPEAAEAP